jgi:hypothetical protein
LIYPLTVASKSQAPARKEAALKILDKMRAHSMIVVEQVCEELGRKNFYEVTICVPVSADIYI